MPQAKKKEEKKEKSCLPKYKLHRITYRWLQVNKNLDFVMLLKVMGVWISLTGGSACLCRIKHQLVLWQWEVLLLADKQSKEYMHNIWGQRKFHISFCMWTAKLKSSVQIQKTIKSRAAPAGSDLPPKQRKGDTWEQLHKTAPQQLPDNPEKLTALPALPSCVQRCTSVWKATEFWKQRSNSRASQNHVNHVSSPDFSKRGSSVTLSCTVCLHTMTFGPDVDIWKALFLSG